MAIDEFEIGAEHFGDDPPLGVVKVTAYGTPGAYEVRLLVTATESVLCDWCAVTLDAQGEARVKLPITAPPGPGVRTLHVRPQCRPPDRVLVSSTIRIRCEG